MGVEHIVGLAVAAALTIYLLYALVRPEKL
jgi:K+-transporting ATPase KdpF subunit